MTHFLACFIVLSVVTIQLVNSDVLGCGGFVKSDVEINFSLVEVRLLCKRNVFFLWKRLPHPLKQDVDIISFVTLLI